MSHPYKTFPSERAMLERIAREMATSFESATLPCLGTLDKMLGEFQAASTDDALRTEIAQRQSEIAGARENVQRLIGQLRIFKV